ncbi:ABC transporter ATP-binding protein [Pseudorhodoferax sp. Leaf267]|uniref:ABC transporter ATP-binding protein n=1 Tax=Pseudorhodoferax sp. Leaf267 TaxID=1736316 RepID=UPI0006F94340|nr:ABC transporter ATP-binding protein [Pseudorhodoferax sp. Leaf267]KQP21555.1 ABC transporter ATP-binding protein [Pseudorhodoferax sp. Leaf267]
MSENILLRARGVEKRFGAVVAASGIEIAIAAGERVSLIGSNGAGKTTFVNMVTGYLKPDTGSIELAGRDITQLAPRAITHLGVARSFQIPQLFAELTVLENMLVATACHGRRLSFWRSARRADAVARADVLLQRFQLAEHRERRVAELPGGVRKLLDIAMALTGEPRLLLLDEPTSGVAAEEKFPMMDVIMTALGQEAMTVLFVEHDMDIVERYADRVVAFYAGRIIADDVPAVALAAEDVRRYVTGTLH